MGGQPVTGEPTTAAGRALLRSIAIDHPTWPQQGLTDDIAAIEAEARAAALADAVAAVEKLLDQYDLVDVREAVAAIKELEEPHQETGEPR